MHTRKRSGFTLIELLVVIAIIAILAAILFPVFAQARAKARQATCQSNLKQLTLAITMYTQDFDETLPLGEWYYTYSYNWGGWTISGGYWNYYPYTLPPGSPSSYPGEESYWCHAISSYIKSNNVWACPQVTNQYEVQNPDYNYAYNGELHGGILASLTSPASAPAIWEGYGNYSIGEPFTSPYLDCNSASDPSQCKYVPSSTNCSYAIPGSTDYMFGSQGYIHGQGINISFADGHVKLRTLGGFGTAFGSYDGGPTDIKTQPWSNYDKFGNSYTPNQDTFGCHSNMFRPDFDPSQK